MPMAGSVLAMAFEGSPFHANGVIWACFQSPFWGLSLGFIPLGSVSLVNWALGIRERNKDKALPLQCFRFGGRRQISRTKETVRGADEKEEDPGGRARRASLKCFLKAAIQGQRDLPHDRWGKRGGARAGERA